MTSSTRDASGNVQEKYREFLVGRPHFSTDALVGRCTRGYIAYNLEYKTLCFLKDSWRSVVPGRNRPEHQVYERLYERFAASGCPTEGLPTVVCGGDVGGEEGQKSRVHSEITEAQPVLRVHYRFLLREVGAPLEEFSCYCVLVDLIRQALDSEHQHHNHHEL